MPYMAGYSALTRTRPHTRKKPGVPGSAVSRRLDGPWSWRFTSSTPSSRPSAHCRRGPCVGSFPCQAHVPLDPKHRRTCFGFPAQTKLMRTATVDKQGKRVSSATGISIKAPRSAALLLLRVLRSDQELTGPKLGMVEPGAVVRLCLWPWGHNLLSMKRPRFGLWP